MLEGTVISVDARGAHVLAGGERLFCRVRGRFYEDTEGQKRPVAPGDEVSVSLTAPGEGAIEEIHPRRTWLSRPSAGREGEEQVLAANVDQVAIVASTKKPPLRPGLIDRLIVAGTNHRLEPFVVINKIDLGVSNRVRGVAEELRGLDYPVLLTSATGGVGVEDLGERLAGKVTVLAGHSGVGKSSLLNALDPELHLKTGEVSKRTRKGRHITTRAELIPIAGGGFVVDTPGIRAFGLWDVERADLDIFFREYEPLIEKCRFHNCNHSHEPDCAVRAAAEAGEVSEKRYAAYLRILGTLE
ncbi:MAG: ribosome small subunit-dependent GTPase A [Planctomycetota bacterium]